MEDKRRVRSMWLGQRNEVFIETDEEKLTAFEQVYPTEKGGVEEWENMQLIQMYQASCQGLK